MNTKILDRRIDSEHIYYNLKLSNIFDGISVGEKPSYINQKVSTILKKQSDYEMSIYYFAINGNIPLFVCPIVEGTNSDANLTPYGVCYSYGGTDYSQQVKYDPTIESSPASLGIVKAPLENNGLQDLSSSYYYIYQFQTFLDMVNASLTNAYNDFNSANPGVHSSPVWVQYDPNNGLFSVIGEYSYSQAGHADVFFNFELLVKYFNTVKAVFYNDNDINFKDWLIRFDSDFTKVNAYELPYTNTPYPANPNYIKNIQEYDTRYNWANILSLVFISNTVQTRGEYLPPVQGITPISTALITNMSIASPSIITCNNLFGFENGDLVNIINSSYSVDGVPASNDVQYSIRNLTYNTFQLFYPNGITPVNVTAFVSGGQIYKNVKANNTFNPDTRSIIAYYDIILDTNDSGANWRQYLYYQPQVLKWVDLVSNEPLNQFDLNIYMQLVNGKLIQLYQQINTSSDIKFLFRKKDSKY